MITRSRSLRRSTLSASASGTQLTGSTTSTDSTQNSLILRTSNSVSLDRAYSAETVVSRTESDNLAMNTTGTPDALDRLYSTDTLVSEGSSPDQVTAPEGSSVGDAAAAVLSSTPPIEKKASKESEAAVKEKLPSTLLKTTTIDLNKTDSDDDSCCAVCLLEMIHPVRLPCSHIFCYLCLKGVTLTNGLLCPLCRGNIPPEFLQQPTLVTPPTVKSGSHTRGRRPKSGGRRGARRGSLDSADGGGAGATASPAGGTEDEDAVDGAEGPDYQWFYEGRNGWWRYDARTNVELEAARTAGHSSLTLLIAGHNFTIDLTNMTQQRATGGGGMIRNIKRDTPLCQAKGTAGLHTSVLLSAGGRRNNSNSKRRKNL